MAVLKSDWTSGQHYLHTDQNAVATQVNTNTTDIANKQAADSDLTAIAALAPANNDVIQRKSGAWTNRTPAQLKTDLAIGTGDISGLTTALADKQDASARNQANGYAGLDNTGKVAAAQLPSYVDDVLEFANLAGFPGTGETGKIYIAIDTGKTYRWSGSVYVVISETLAIGTTSSTAKAGDYQPSWSDVTGKPAVIASGADQAAARTAIGAVDTGDSRLSDARTPTDGSVTVTKIAAATLVTASEGIASNNNDTTIPTSAAVKAYADSVGGGGGGGGGTVDSIIPGNNIDVDNTDPANPVVSVEALTADDFTDGTTNKVLTATEKTKLSGIEALADVTDATNVAAAGAQMTSAKNQNNGYAGLDSSGLIPSALLPSYVDDVIEAANYVSLPASGATGKIYVTLDTNKTYRWTGSAYVEISASPGSTDSVTEGSTNLYYTNSRADARIAAAVGVTVQAYDSDLTAFAAKTAPSGAVVGTTDSQTLTNKTLTSPAISSPTGLVKGDVGLGNVDNTSNTTERAAARTLTNARVTKRYGTTSTSSGAATVDTDSYDVVRVTLTANTTLTFSGTPTHGQQTLVEFVGTTGYTLTHPSNTTDSGVATRLAASLANKTHRVFYVYDTVTSKHVCMAVDTAGY